MKKSQANHDNIISQNSTRQLAFLDNMVGINDSEFSPRGGTIRVWEWKGGTLPFETSN
jgi:hypothetical protein